MNNEEEIYKELLALVKKNNGLLSASADLRENFIKAAWTLVDCDISYESIASLKGCTSSNLRHEDSLTRDFLNAGVSPESIERYTKIMHYEVLYGVLSMLDDSSEQVAAANINPPEYYGLFQVDENNYNIAIKYMRGMHELLLKFDPNQREMRPPKDSEE